MIKKLLARRITNPVLKDEGTYTSISNNPLGALIARLWYTMLILGGIALIIFLVWGAIDWLMSEGDQEKLKNAKNKITHALAGMGLLAVSYAVVRILEGVFGFDLLNIVWPTP